MSRTTDVYDQPAENPRVLHQQLRDVAAELKAMGVGVQAEFIERAADVIEPPPLLGILASLDHPQMFPTPKLVYYLAGKLMAATDLIRALVDDAEITGSTDTISRAQAWLSAIGIDLDEFVEIDPDT